MPSSRPTDPHHRLTSCRLCPRLVEWREAVADRKRAAYAGEPYWGRPVPSRGPWDARLLVVGLAPAAHGGNRTGLLFSGDRSGEWLFRSLHRFGYASTPDHTDPALTLTDCRITAVCHCAPPANRPTPGEVRTCVETWLVPELAGMAPRVTVALGSLAWGQLLRVGRELGWPVPRPTPRFGHRAEVDLAPGPRLIGSYHPSQQNTFTGRLTEVMFDAVWRRTTEVLDG